MCIRDRYEGYVTEKLLTSLQAHTVPIYWGDPGVKEEFNEKAFIYVNDCANLEEVIKKVQYVEENRDIWCKMIMEPWQTDEQIKKQEKQMDEYHAFIENIFDQNIEDASRKPQGTYPEEYRKWYKQGFFMGIKEFIYRVGRKMQKHS